MTEDSEQLQASKIEVIFMVGIIGCMLFATWELGHLMAHEWFKTWVAKDRFTNARIIRYGIAFFMSITSVIFAAFFTPKFGRFGNTISRAFLWYGTLLLMSTIAIFLFDCLPEVCAGFIGAGIFVFAIYVLQKRVFTKERVAKTRLRKGQCPACGSPLLAESLFCSQCGREVGKKCPTCKAFTRLMDSHCSQCGGSLG
ncbi:MAG: zinc ribbon domain-containing protein [Phycisphaerales bacterium]|nr:MAG: zinc ribbon domain-containing protein [Phycisphaerales bacterium]